VEEGGNNLNDPSIIFPLLFMAHLIPTSNATLFYQATAEAQLGGRELVVPSGGVLGGGSSINLMMYSRAQRSDFDAWATNGWRANDMIPYLKKVSPQLINVIVYLLLTFIYSSRLTLVQAQRTLTAPAVQKKFLVERIV
jgi:choline dehydrogenase-like flavoprotein